MTAIIFLLLGGFLVYVVMQANSRKKETLDSAPLGDDELQLAHFKRRIFHTSAYTEESTYQALYFRIKQLTQNLIINYSENIIGENVASAIDEEFEKYFEIEADEWRVRRGLQIENVSPEVLLAISLESLLGSKQHQGKKIARNKFFANRAIEYLIAVKSYKPAVWIKAIVLLFGFEEYSSPQVSEAEKTLNIHGFEISELAIRPKAIAELRTVETLPNSHAVTTQYWRTQAEFDEIIPKYHPSNING